MITLREQQLALCRKPPSKPVPKKRTDCNQIRMICSQIIRIYLLNVEAALSGYKVNTGLGEHTPDEKFMRYIETNVEPPIKEEGVSSHRKMLVPLLSRRMVDINDLPYSLGIAIRKIAEHYVCVQEFLVYRGSISSIEERNLIGD
jgi:hypothetical protein